jgi:hypothetical protein
MGEGSEQRQPPAEDYYEYVFRKLRDPDSDLTWEDVHFGWLTPDDSDESYQIQFESMMESLERFLAASGETPEQLVEYIEPGLSKDVIKDIKNGNITLAHAIYDELFGRVPIEDKDYNESEETQLVLSFPDGLEAVIHMSYRDWWEHDEENTDQTEPHLIINIDLDARISKGTDS